MISKSDEIVQQGQGDFQTVGRPHRPRKHGGRVPPGDRNLTAGAHPAHR
jgi:hypothetical protein